MSLLRVDPKKIRAIMEWPTARNMTNVGSLMGLEGYYERFIKIFSRLTHPITSLQRKNVKFDWSEKCEESFQ
jgi:hypothetical protein